MDIESYFFTVLASVTGMGVVFAVLTLLSCMMFLLARIARGRKEGSGDPPSGRGVAPPESRREGVDEGVLPPVLVVIAAAAHHHIVCEGDHRSARPWVLPDAALSGWSIPPLK